MEEAEKDWIDAEDLAARCGVSKGTVYGWIQKGKVTAKTSYHFRKGRYLVDVSTVPARYAAKIRAGA